MSQSLSTATNWSAVISLIDVVVRAAREASSFLGTIKDAPQDIQSLETDLQGISTLLLETRDCILGSQIAIQGSAVNQLITFVSGSLAAVHNELLTLATDLDQAHRGNLLAAGWASFKWGWEQARISRLTKCLESHKLTLVAALTIMRGYHTKQRSVIL